MAQRVRVQREYFLSDVELRKALGVPPSTIILAIERRLARHKGQAIASLEGSLVTVYDPKEAA